MKNQKEDDNLDPTVFTVPINRPFIVTKEEYEEMLKNAPKTPLTREERAAIRKRVEKLFTKPERKKNEE